ncbi:MAG: hypothetical protein KF687_10645 [Cyclobacteriaceae bacterium]|nr:hypothetical protein [Cyclobacteriaceae bacterium]
MRKELAIHKGERKKFRAVFSRLGKKMNFKGYSEETILLSNIVDADTNKLVTDHIWFSYSKAFEKINLTSGCILEFDARVKTYKKGYINTRYRMNNQSLDFKLSHPTKIRKIEV